MTSLDGQLAVFDSIGSSGRLIKHVLTVGGKASDLGGILVVVGL